MEKKCINCVNEKYRAGNSKENWFQCEKIVLKDYKQIEQLKYSPYRRDWDLFLYKQVLKYGIDGNGKYCHNFVEKEYRDLGQGLVLLKQIR